MSLISSVTKKTNIPPNRVIRIVTNHLSMLNVLFSSAISTVSLSCVASSFVSVCSSLLFCLKIVLICSSFAVSLFSML